ncbi:hypothetical protein D3C85_1594050 [compost metagenome]
MAVQVDDEHPLQRLLSIDVRFYEQPIPMVDIGGHAVTDGVDQAQFGMLKALLA